ncbi:MAG: lysophospholipid acyltransferase family protein [Gammaproteobacteria bacterium]
MKTDAAGATGAPPPMRMRAALRRFAAPRYWPVWLLVALLRMLAWLPLPLLYALGQLCGELAFHLHRRRRMITRRNLAACFPHLRELEIRQLARRHFRALTAAAFATGIGWWARPARLARLTHFRRRSMFERARAGRNVILLAPHFVGLEYGGIRLSLDAPMLSMYQHHKNPHLDAVIAAGRARFGISLYARHAPLKSMIRAIRAGRQFYYLPDQDPGDGKSVFAPFFSIPTATYGALGRLARLSDACVIPCATRILPRGRGFEIIFAPPLADFPSGDDARDAAAMNRAIEELIALMPEQYLWSHRRFKTRPPGELPFYD